MFADYYVIKNLQNLRIEGRVKTDNATSVALSEGKI